ncbi:MAG: dicarboxylate/amino acid:cation symporter [Alphaproteobacteria bacterium]
MSSRTSAMPLTIRVLIGLAAGLVAGIGVSLAQDATLTSAASHVELIGILWVNAIRMTVIPLVISLIIVSIVAADIAAIATMGGRTLALFLLLLAGTALFAVLVAPALMTWLPSDAGARALAAPAGLQATPTLGEWLLGLIPPNPFKAASDGSMLALVIFAVLFGAAATRVTKGARDALTAFFQAVADAMLVLVRWLIWLAPIAVFALILGLSARMGAAAAGALGYFVVVLSAMLAALTALLYPISVMFGGVPLSRFAKGVFPAQTVAFTSRSSLASLPALIEGAKDILKLPQPVSGFVLPLAVSTFKISAPISFMVGGIFLAHLYGIELGWDGIAVIALLSFFVSFASPGVPSGGPIIMAPFYASVGLPPEGIGILIAVDLVPDIFKTVVNVTGNMTVATIVARWQGSESKPRQPRGKEVRK